MAFNETRLPDDVEKGASGGPGFKTSVTVRSSGKEQRNSEWSTTRGEWDIGYGILTKEDFAVVLAVFYAQRGRLDGFRFKDWSDFELADQQIALGDDTTTVFQIFKRYTFGAVNFDRDLTRIITGTIVVRLDGVLQTDPGDYTIDLDTGLITMVVAPASTGGTGPSSEEVLSVECDFEVPVRFDTDTFGITLEVFNAGAIPNLPIVELKDE